MHQTKKITVLQTPTVKKGDFMRKHVRAVIPNKRYFFFAKTNIIIQFKTNMYKQSIFTYKAHKIVYQIRKVQTAS